MTEGRRVEVSGIKAPPERRRPESTCQASARACWLCVAPTCERIDHLQVEQKLSRRFAFRVFFLFFLAFIACLRAPAAPGCRTRACSPPSGSWSRKGPPALACSRLDPPRPSGPASCCGGSAESPHQRRRFFMLQINRESLRAPNTRGSVCSPE